MKTSNGFTLIELVIVIIIISVLAIVGVPAYQTYMRKAMVTEGRNLTNQIVRAEKMYYIDHNEFYKTPSGYCGTDIPLGIDSRANQYFATFGAGYGAISVPWYAQDKEGFRAWANGSMSIGLYVEANGDHSHETVLYGVKYQGNWIEKDW